jgi:glycosyltransferase involved in cell wall biosynthesis
LLTKALGLDEHRLIDVESNSRSEVTSPLVLIALPCLEQPGGVANYYRTLRPLLDERKVFFEVGKRPGEAGTGAAFRRLLRDYWRFHRALSRDSFDLVHLNPSLVPLSLLRDALFLLIAKAHRRLVLVFFRGWDPACEATIRRRCPWAFRSVYGVANAVIVLAEEFRRSLRSLGISAPIFVETTVAADSSFEEPVRAAHGVSDELGQCRVLYLSRLDRNKGLLEAIDALERLRADFPRVTLTVAGDGPERASAEATVRERGIPGVTFLGHVDGVAKSHAFGSADIFLFPTFAEGMPNAILEAMAHGLPIVTRAVGGLADFFDDGRMGYITESRDPAVFAQLVGRLASDPELRASIGRYNREYAHAHFKASVVASRLETIYDEVNRRRPHASSQAPA